MNKYERYLHYLKQYVAFKTVSLPGHENPDEIRLCVNFLKNLLEEGGIKVTLWEEEKLNPIIFGSYFQGENLPTLLLYGHYDVVAVKESEWKMTTPFDVIEKNGVIYGRGTSDNKGQNLAYILELADLIEAGKLSVNIKFFIEGNEETGSAGIDRVIEKYKEELAADCIVMSDSSIVGTTPAIELSVRGLINLQVDVRTAEDDLHSGSAGGVAYNSVIEAAKLIASLHASDGLVHVPGFNFETLAKDVSLLPSVIENNRIMAEKVNLTQLFKTYELKKVGNPFAAIGLLPAIEITGIIAGEAHMGFKNIIPAQTSFGINCRLVGDQDPDSIAGLLTKYLRSVSPSHVKLDIKITAKAKPTMLTPNPVMKSHIAALLTEVYGEAPLDKYVGGGIPVVGFFKDILGVDPLLVPLANDNCNMHGPDENITVYCVEKALLFIERLLSTPLPKLKA